MAEQSLKDKTVKGVGWSAVDNVSRYAVTFIVSIILARLLSPDDYGLLGITAIFTVVCNTLIEGGFSSALIRKKDVSKDDYSTAFIVNISLSVFLYAVIFLSAPLIAHFFGRLELVLLVRVSSLELIAGAIAMVQRVRFTKELDFKTQTKISIITSVSSGLIGILLALLGCGVWALVVQGLVRQLLNTLMLLLYSHWFPGFSFSKKCFKDLFGFGWKMMVVGLIDSTWKELTQVVIGRFYSPAALGQYTRAKSFSDILSQNLTGTVQRVSFPVLSEIQDDKARMIAAYRRIIKTTMFITAVSMLFLGAVSEPLLFCLIGAKWHEASTFLPLICICGSLYPLHAINLNMLQIQGRSDLFLKLEFIKKTILLASLFIGAFVGIKAMLYANIATNILSFFLNSFYSGKLLGYSSWMQIKDIIPSYSVAMIVSIPVFFLKYLPLSNWIILPIQLIAGIAFFFAVCHITKSTEYFEVKRLLTPLIDRFKH